MNLLLSAASVTTDQSESANMMGWVVVYAPLLIVLVAAVLWAKGRNRAIRERLERIEGKLDQLIDASRK